MTRGENDLMPRTTIVIDLRAGREAREIDHVSSFDEDRFGRVALHVAAYCIGGIVDPVDLCGDQLGMKRSVCDQLEHGGDKDDANMISSQHHRTHRR